MAIAKMELLELVRNAEGGDVDFLPRSAAPGANGHPRPDDEQGPTMWWSVYLKATEGPCNQ